MKLRITSLPILLLIALQAAADEPPATAIELPASAIELPAAAIELEASPELSTSGTFNLSWQGRKGETFRLLQLTGDEPPRLIYQGMDTARVMTGLPSGDYTYRVEGESGRSEQRSVTVAHHNLSRAFSFFGVGLLVFIATVVLVIRGEKGQ